MKIQQKIVLIFIMIILCIWATIFFIRNSLINIDKEFDILKNDVIPYATIIVGIDKTITETSYLLIDYVKFNKVENINKIQKGLDNITKQRLICINNIKDMEVSKQQNANKLICKIITFTNNVQTIIDLKKKGINESELFNTMDTLFYPSIINLADQSSKYKIYCITEFIKIKGNIHNVYTNNMLILLLLFILVIILSAILLFCICKTVLEPVNKLYKDVIITDNTNEIIKTSKDELFLLIKSFKITLNKLKHSTVSLDDYDKEIAERKRAEKERAEAEQALKESEKRFKDIARSMSDWIWEVDPNMIYTYSSSNVGPILGYNKNDIIGKSLFDFMLPKEANRFKIVVNDIVKNKKPFRYLETCNVTKDDRRVHLSTSGIPMFDDDNKFIGYRGVCVDITENIILKQHLRYALKMESISSLAGNIAHGFNNMFNIITGYSDIIESKLKLNDPILKDLKELKKATTKSISINKQLLAFSRQQKTAFQIMDVNKIIKNMECFLTSIVEEDIQIKFKLGKNIWNIWADLPMIDQILANLAINARDAMKCNGKLIIETKNVIVDKDYRNNNIKFIPDKFITGDFVLITITDNGIGMDDETISHIFDPFFTTKGTSNNTGLGLSTVYGNIKQNKGYIDVHSTVGKGTTFKLYFPKHHGKIIKPKLPLIKEIKSANIVLVEDNNMMRNLTELMITSIGHKVTAFKNSKDAIKFCNDSTNKLDILFTDVIIPDMNGMKLKEIIKSENPKIKTIFMSGYSKNILAEQGILKENINFLNKPFTIKDMKKEIEKVFYN